MEDLLCLEALILENIDLLFKKCRGSAEIQAEGSLNLYEDILSFLLIYKAIKEGNILKDGWPGFRFAKCKGHLFSYNRPQSKIK